MRNRSQFLREGKSSLGADHRERERARMPPPPVVCPGCQAHTQHARPHAGAQAGRKRQSSWKTRVWSEPTRCSCQAEQLWPTSANASLPFTRRTSGERMQPSGDRWSIRAGLEDRSHVAESGRFVAASPGTVSSLVSCFTFLLLMSNLSQSSTAFPKCYVKHF